MGQKMPVVRIDLSSCPTGAAWYTVVTLYNYEKKYADDLMKGVKNAGLEGRILDTVVAFRETEYTTISKSGKESKKVKVEKVMPLYVFVKAVMDEQVWDYLRNTTGAHTVLAAGGCPSIMDDDDINKIKLACGLLEKEHVEFNGEIGDAVMIIGGPFLNYTGEVQSIKNGKAKICLIDEESAELGMTVEIETAYLEVI